MEPSSIFSILMLAIVAYLGYKILKGLIKTIVLIFLLFLVFLVISQTKGFRSIPLIGNLTPTLPSSLKDFIALAKGFFWKIEIKEISRDSEGNLLIGVENKGIFSVSNFSVLVDGNEAKILNKPKDPLKSKESTIIQVDWKFDFSRITIKTEQTQAYYEKS